MSALAPPPRMTSEIVRHAVRSLDAQAALYRAERGWI